MQAIRLSYVCPLALLWLLASVHAKFSQLLRASALAAQRSICRVLFYADEARPGNVLRPDPARSFLAVYFTVTEFPKWLRWRSTGWLPACFVRSSTMNTIAGGAAGVLWAILAKTWGERGQHNLELTGIRLPQTDFIFRARYQGLLGDEKLLKQALGVKGASGIKPCFMCKNIVAGDFPGPPDPYCRCLLTHSVAQFDQHTDDSLLETTDLLDLQASRLRVTEVKELEKVLGLSRDRFSLLGNRAARRLVRPISGSVWDWMHCLCSGGVLQEELDQFVGRLQAEGVTLAEVDAFAQQVTLPKSRVLKRGFCQARWRGPAGPGGFFRVFASETLSLAALVGLFAELVLPGVEQLQPHAACFALLLRATKLLCSGDAVLSQLTMLQSLLERHHEHFGALYPDAVRPKMHFLLHIPQCLASVGANVSCFATERKHRTAKLFANHIFNDFELSLTSSVLNHDVHAMQVSRLVVASFRSAVSDGLVTLQPARACSAHQGSPAQHPGFPLATASLQGLPRPGGAEEPQGLPGGSL